MFVSWKVVHVKKTKKHRFILTLMPRKKMSGGTELVKGKRWGGHDIPTP